VNAAPQFEGPARPTRRERLRRLSAPREVTRGQALSTPLLYRRHAMGGFGKN